MNRRHFLAWLGGTAAGFAASQVWDIERMLWVPGQKTLFVPSGQMNTYITPEWIIREVLANVHDGYLKMNTFITPDSWPMTVSVRPPKRYL